MNLQKLKKILYASAALSLFPVQASPVREKSAEVVNLAELKPSWVTVLSGNPFCEPVRNSFGYITLDDGKGVSAFTQDGKIIWQRHLTSRLKPLLTVGAADMIYLISRDGDLNMLNPGGLLLWTTRTGFSVTEAPLVGKDGRIYTRGSSSIACYSIKGTCRWKISVECQNTNIPLTELNDGSLLVFTTKLKEGKTVAYTVSPFGELGEEVLFAGQVAQVSQTSYGSLVSFTDGSVGLCSERNGNVYSHWAIKAGNEGFSAPTSIITTGFEKGKAAFITGQMAKVILVETETGKILSNYDTGFTHNGLCFKGKTSQGFVISDKMKAECYDDEGNKIWTAKFDPKNHWSYVFPTDEGYIGFCSSNWVIQGYRIKQNLGRDSKSSYTAHELSAYTNIYKNNGNTSSDLMGQALTNKKINEMMKSFRDGNSAEKERKWIPVLTSEMNSIVSAWMQENSGAASTNGKSYFTTNLDYTQKILNLAAASGTATFNKNYVYLLKHVTDQQILNTLVKNTGVIAYDPEGSMLSALESLTKTNVKNELLLKNICDSTFEICKFMGRPAFFRQGREILTSLMGDPYPQGVKEYARATLKKFIDINL